jgi:hypothetical protein
VSADQGSLPVGPTRRSGGAASSQPAYSSVSQATTPPPTAGRAVVAAVDSGTSSRLQARLDANSGSLTSLRDDQLSRGLGAAAGGATVGTPMTVTLADGQKVTGTVGALVDPVFTIPGQVLMSSSALLKAEPTLQPQLLAVQTEAGQAEQVQKSLEDLVSGYTSVQVTPGNIFGAAIKTIFNFLIDAVNKSSTSP